MTFAFIDSYRLASASVHPVQQWVNDNSSKVIAYYKCDDCADDATMADSSGNGYDGGWENAGNNNNTRTLGDGTEGADITASANGDDAGGLCPASEATAFDACDGFFAVAEHDDDNTRAMFYASRDPQTGTRVWALRRSGGFLQLRINGSTNVVSVAVATAGVRAADGEFTIGWTKVGSTYYVYVNGSEVGSATGAALNSNTSMAGGVGGTPNAGTTVEFAINGAIGHAIFLDGASTTDLADLHTEYASGL